MNFGHHPTLRFVFSACLGGLVLMLFIAPQVRAQANLTINDNTSNFQVSGNGTVGSPYSPNATGTSNLTWTTLLNSLNSGNVFANTTAGDITISQSPNAQAHSGVYNTTNDLLLNASANLTLNASLSNFGSGNLGLSGGNFVFVNQTLSLNGTLTASANTGNIGINAPIAANSLIFNGKTNFDSLNLTVTTSGMAGQTYNGTVQFGHGNYTLTALNGGNLTFNSQLNSIADNLTLATSGQVIINSNVSIQHNLFFNGSLSVANGIVINSQENLTVNAPATFGNGGQLNGRNNLFINAPLTMGTGAQIMATGAITSVIAINSTVNTSDLYINSGGNISINNGGSINATGPIVSQSTIRLNANTTITSGGNIDLISSWRDVLGNDPNATDLGIDGNYALTVNLPSNFTSQGAIGYVTPLASLTINGGGENLFYGNVITQGDQYYKSLVETQGLPFNIQTQPTTRIASLQNGTISFMGGLETHFNTLVQTSGNVIVSGLITNTANLSIQAGNITLNGSAILNGSASLQANGTIALGSQSIVSITISNGGSVSALGGVTLAQNAGSHVMLALNNGTLASGGTNGFSAGAGSYSITSTSGTLAVVGSDLTTNLPVALLNGTASTFNTNGLNGTWSGQLSGSGGLIKAGAGTLTLNTTNTYTGNTTISTGTLLLANAGALQNSTLNYNVGDGTLSLGTLTNATLGGLSGNKDIALSTATNITVNLTVGANNAPTTYSGNLSDNQAGANFSTLTKVGTGTLTLSGVLGYQGSTTVSAGTLVLNGATGTSFASQVPSLTVGNGSLVVQNGGNLTLRGFTIGAASATNSTALVTGTTTKIQSTEASTTGLTVGYDGKGNLTIANGANVTVSNVDVGSLASGNGTVTVTDTGTKLNYVGGTGNPNLLTAGTNGTASVTVANGALISGSQGVVGQSAGANGSVTVTGTNSTWLVANLVVVGANGTGSLTTSNGGMVNITAADLASNTTSLSLGAGNGSTGTGTVTGAGSQWTMAAALIVGGNGTGSLTISNGATVTDTIGVVGLNSTAGGNVTVTGANSIWNNTNILTVGAVGFAVLPGISASGGNGSLTITNGGSVTAAALYYGQLTTNFSPTGQNGNITVNGTTSHLDVTGNMVGGGNVTVANGGNITVGGNLTENGYNGTTITVTDAISVLTVQGFTSLGQYYNNSLTIANGGVVNSLGADGGNVNVVLGNSTTGNLTGNASVLVSGANSAWNIGNFSNQTGSLVIGNAGNATVTIANGGIVSIFGNNLTLAAAGGSNGTLNLNAGGMLKIGGANGILAGAGNATVNLAGGTLQVNNANFTTSANATFAASTSTTLDSNGFDATWSGGMSGNGSLVKTGNGTLTLNGNFGKSGSTFVNGGTLAFSNTNASTTNMTLNVNSGTLNVVNNSTLNVSGVLSLDIGMLTGSNATALFSGPSLSLAGSLTSLTIGDIGTGNATLANGANLSFDLVKLGSISTGTGTLLVTGAGTQLRMASGCLTVGQAGNGTLTIANGASVTGNRVDMGSQFGRGNITVTDANSSLTLANALNIGITGSAFVIGNGGQVSDQSAVVGAFLTQNSTHNATANISGTGSQWTTTGNLTLAQSPGSNGTVNQTGGTVTIGTGLIFGAGNGTYNLSGGTLQIGGVIQASNSNAKLNITGGAFQVAGSDLNASLNMTLAASNTALDTNGFNATWSGVLSGSGNLTKLGNGTLTLSGLDNYTGTTTISSGTLAFTTSNTSAFSSNIVNNASLLFNPATSANFTQTISGNGTVEKSGNGTEILSGNNTYTGGTTVSGGTLALAGVGNSSITGSGLVSVTANGTLAGTGRVGGNATVNGTLMPGNATQGGLLLFSQNLTLGANATSNFQLNGTVRGNSYGAITVTGNFGLSGTLLVSLLNSFLPTLGSTFTLFQVSGVVSGVFSNVVLPSLGTTLGWNTAQLGNAGSLSVATINFTQWTSAVGLSGNSAQAAARPFGTFSNYARYAMNLDASANPAGAPVVSAINGGGTNYLVIDYRVRKNMTDCTVVPQYSTDLVSWTNVPAENITYLDDADIYTADYEANVIRPAQGSVFLRIAVQPAP